MLKHATAASLSLALLATSVQAEEPKLESERDKASYLIGRNIGETINRDGIKLNIENLVMGLREGLTGKDSKISEADAVKIMETFQAEMQKQAEAKAASASAENVAAGTKFLADNKKREGVKVTKSGLQYEVISAGKGAKPTPLDTVTVHYHGTLIDGTVFDSSVERKSPATFPVNGVIAGWTEALQLMEAGAKYKLFIPADLAYGKNGAGRDIGPNSTLIFEVELLSIKGQEKK
ncbi:MAG: FKBP-type peptidyl-prolyl cis-trans isomerase [Roseibacillus sp.]|nr:FKBP-type peptidyl-prolyl cis-trans isomerase [Roseibacillus sp.]